MKIFITGATGVLGKRVVKLLIESENQVIGLTRTKEKSQQLKNIGADAAQIDLFNANELIDATEGCDALLHLATNIPKKTMPKSRDWMMNDKIRIEGTKNLITAINHNGIKRFIGQSITALYGQQNGDYITGETRLPTQQIKMLESAFEMEKIIREGLINNYILLRFGTFYSSDAYHTQDLLQSVKKGKLPMIGDGNFHFNFIHVDDAARSIVYGLENFERLKGKALNISDFKPILYNDLLNELRIILNGKKPVKLPHWFVRLLLGKDVYGFLTNSYRIKQSPELVGLPFQKESFLSEISKIIQEKTKGEK